MIELCAAWTCQAWFIGRTLYFTSAKHAGRWQSRTCLCVNGFYISIYCFSFNMLYRLQYVVIDTDEVQFVVIGCP